VTTQRGRASALLAALALLAGACSVKTPRHESAYSPTRSQAAQVAGLTTDTGLPTDETVLASTESTLANATSTTGVNASGEVTSTSAVDAGHAAAASAPSVATPGVAKDTITVSIIAGFSGPLAAMVTRAYDGLLTWQDDVNAAGGINGRKIQFKKVDHKDTADGGVAACKEAQSNGTYFAMVPEGVDATVTAVGCLDAAGIPSFYYSATTDPKWKRAFADIISSQQAGGCDEVELEAPPDEAGRPPHALGVAQDADGVSGGRDHEVLHAGVLQPQQRRGERRRVGLDRLDAGDVEPEALGFG
jgi:hypothetical protein